MLWYLHLCSEAGVVVTDYIDNAKGTMTVTDDGGGHFTEVTLYPEVTITDKSMEEKAMNCTRKLINFVLLPGRVIFLYTIRQHVL